MKLYTPDLAGSGQFLKCAHCKLDPTEDGHDGCLGESYQKITTQDALEIVYKVYVKK